MPVPFSGRPTPPVTPDTEGWWEATRDRRLTIQRCRRCGHKQLYPRDLCISCRCTDLELVDAAGTGTIYSFSVTHRSPDEEHFHPPYVVALVRLTEGPAVTTNIVDSDPGDLRCDLPVMVTWERLEDGRHLPLFALDPGAPGPTP